MPIVNARLRRAVPMSVPSLEISCRSLDGNCDLLRVFFIRSNKIDLNSLKVHLNGSYRRDIPELIGGTRKVYIPYGST